MWDTEHPEEAWDFVKWCTCEEIIGWAALEGHIVPGRVDVAQSDAYLHSGKRPANMSAFIQSQGFSVPIYPHPWWKRIASEFEPSLNQYNVGSEGVQISATQMLEEMQASLQIVLDEYQAEYGGK